LTEALARLRNDSVLSRPAKASPASRGIVRGFADRAKSLPARVYVGAVLTALLVAIAVNALLLQRGRHPAPLFGPQQPKASPPPSDAGSASALSAADIARGTSPAAAQVLPPARTATANGSAQRAPDQIGDFLGGEPQHDDERLTIAAQNALVKLGYVIKADGKEGVATHQALRDFEHMHGLPLTTEITPRLVKKLTSAARNAAR